MAELWDQELYISYNLTFNKSRWAPRDRRDGSEGLKTKIDSKSFFSSFFHSWVVASIGDLKLLALLGVLVLKSFCLPMNITLSLVKLGFINPSWPEPSLSDDLEIVKIRKMSCLKNSWLSKKGSMCGKMYIWSISYPSYTWHTIS